MHKTERVGNVICWLIIAWAAIWLCLFAIPGFVDRCSRHEDAWAREFGKMVSEKVSCAD